MVRYNVKAVREWFIYIEAEYMDNGNVHLTVCEPREEWIEGKEPLCINLPLSIRKEEMMYKYYSEKKGTAHNVPPVEEIGQDIWFLGGWRDDVAIDTKINTALQIWEKMPARSKDIIFENALEIIEEIVDEVEEGDAEFELIQVLEQNFMKTAEEKKKEKRERKRQELREEIKRKRKE